uniref:Uncharacterized protein n=1 Tax=Anguilla anguilla TaxID=7936 RepID=A0A0E9U818_ANGAN
MFLFLLLFFYRFLFSLSSRTQLRVNTQANKHGTGVSTSPGGRH